MALKDRARLKRRLCRLLTGTALAAGGLFPLPMPLAAAEPSAPTRDFSTYIPTGQATRIEASEAPAIDGLLDDAAWAKARVIDEFYQLDPDTGAPGTEKTELRILYDSENLYVGIYNYDREPHLISNTQRSRDGNLGADDSVRIYLDPLNDWGAHTISPSKQPPSSFIPVSYQVGYFGDVDSSGRMKFNRNAQTSVIRNQPSLLRKYFWYAFNAASTQS